MICLIPTWGLRRNFAQKFNYEFKAGLGIGKILQKGYDTQIVPELSFKIGYDFQFQILKINIQTLSIKRKGFLFLNFQKNLSLKST